MELEMAERNLREIHPLGKRVVQMKEFDLTGLSILVVEENHFMQQLLGRIFQEFGVRSVKRATTTTEAFKDFESASFDLVFTNWAPSLDALEFLHHIRHRDESPNPFVPVIVVSAHSEKRFVLNARDSGMTEFLVKPISPRTLYNRICNVIENDRPFVEASEYFGPDLRRRNEPYLGMERRVVEAEMLTDAVEPSMTAGPWKQMHGA